MALAVMTRPARHRPGLLCIFGKKVSSIPSALKYVYQLKLMDSMRLGRRHHALMLSGLAWGPLKRQVRWDIIGSLEFEFQTLNYYFS